MKKTIIGASVLASIPLATPALAHLGLPRRIGGLANGYLHPVTVADKMALANLNLVAI